MTKLNRIESIHIKGFRSLADVKVDNLSNPMVMLGINGAGKSNILRFLELLQKMCHHQLGEFVQQQGGADDQLFGGRRVTQQIEAAISFHTALGSSRFSFTLRHGNPDQFTVMDEQFRFALREDRKGESQRVQLSILERCGPESGFFNASKSPTAKVERKMVADMLGDCISYQFHDTSDASPIKTRWDMEDNHRLLGHGGNLASILIRLKENDISRYDMICKHIGRVVPEFQSFQLEANYGKTLLRWKAKATDKTIGAHLTSDGSLRCFLLITLLNLPDDMLPSIILLDEPELGLHPFATSLISNMIKSLSHRRQVIVATQSPHFVDAFGLENIVVLEMRDGRTETKRFNEKDFSEWLDDHSTGQLWWSHLLGGYP